MGSQSRRTLAALGLAIGGLLLGAPSALASVNVFIGNGTSNSTLNIFQDAASDDQLTTSLAGGTFTITDSTGATALAPPCTQADPNTVNCPLDPPDPSPPNPPNAPVSTLSVHLGSGNDTFTNNTPIGTDSIPSTNTCALGNLIDMGAGNDVVNGGTAAEAIFGGAGNDVLNGGGGNDDLDGGSSCFLLARHARPSHRNEFDGSDVLIGGPGDDTAHYDERTDPLNITLDGVANDGAPGEHDNVQTENVIGGSANDQITGDGAANTLDGSAGNDLLQGLGGSDRLIGGPGNDALVGGPARDHNACGSGFDEAVVTPVDTADGDCERTGAQPGTNTARVHGGKAKLWVVCPSQESATCAGTIAVRLHTQQVGTASFSVAAGKRGRSTVQLGKRATNLINRSGSALLTFDVFTNEPDGTSQHRGQLLLTH